MDNSKKNDSSSSSSSSSSARGGGGGSGSCLCWTNERHVRFLNSIEASFVRAMFDHRNSNRNSNANHRRYSLRLDRQLPDCFDSTRDVGKDRRRRHSISTSDAAGEYSYSARTVKKSKISSSHDQVVPQLENGIEDDDGIKAEKEKGV